jgi:hypothetical protein
VAKLHYWTNFRADDDDETSLSTVTPLVVLSQATRDKADTLLRVIYWAKLVATVGTAVLPNLDWIAGAFVDYLLFFDTESDGHAVNLDDQDPHTYGFSRLNHSVWTTPTTNKYVVSFQGPAVGINLEGSRKGYSAVNKPSLSVQRWVSDNHGVFDNFAGYSIQFTSRVAGRALWASDLPAPP